MAGRRDHKWYVLRTYIAYVTYRRQDLGSLGALHRKGTYQHIQLGVLWRSSSENKEEAATGKKLVFAVCMYVGDRDAVSLDHSESLYKRERLSLPPFYSKDK